MTLRETTCRSNKLWSWLRTRALRESSRDKTLVRKAESARAWPSKARVLVLRSLAFAAVLFGGGISPCKAQLKWEREEVQLSTAAGDTQATGTYAFTNAGKEAVEIKTIKTSCGCTAAVANAKVYRPGEKGTINVVFTLEGRRGLQRKVIVVDTDYAATPRKILTLVVNIATGPRWEPHSLEWRVGSEPEARTVRLTGGPPLKIAHLKATSAKVSVSGKAFGPGAYEIIAVPQSTAEPLSGMIQVKFGAEGKETLNVPFRIRK